MQHDSWLWIMLWGARLVLLVLVALSVASVAVILDRRKAYLLEKNDAFVKAREALRAGNPAAMAPLIAGLPEGSALSGYLRLLQADLKGAPAVSVDRLTRSYLTERRAGLEKGLTLLATIGSNAPFIGLFGTVLGIIQAFGELSSKQGGTASVMASISEALIATAVGLLVAIPAVVAFNAYQRRVREILAPCEMLRDEFVAQLESSATTGGSRSGG